MYVYVHCGSCAPCALHSGRSLRFQEVPRSSDAVGNMRCSRAMATRYRIAFGQYSLAAPNHSHSQAALMTQLAITRSEEHTSELQSLMRSSYAVFCLKKKKN